MEERLIDKEDERLIRIKKKAGETDAEDATLPDGEEETEEEILVTLPDGEDEEYDEDLVGLTPSELAREKARRKRAEEEARAEFTKLVAAAKEALDQGDFEHAEPLFAQAYCYAFADSETAKGLWTARTRNFTRTDPFYVAENAEEFEEADEDAKRFVREKIGDRLARERKELQAEEEALAPRVNEAQQERRQAFKQNRRYYGVRVLAFLGVLVAFAIATAVSGSFIVRTLSDLPVILTGVFGGLTLLAFVIAVVFLLKYTGANKLCRTNEKLSSTEEGARLEELRFKLGCLNTVLDGENAAE